MAVQEQSNDHPREKIMKSGKKVLLVAQEIKLAKVLAGNNKTARDRALKNLKKWFAHRSQTLAFNENDFQRIWKGLYFSMWMSDKLLIQEECASNIASLIHFQTLEESLLFFKAGLTILMNEWFGIDQLRLDKFLLLIRLLLREMLVVVKERGFTKKNVDKFNQAVSSTILNAAMRPPVGLFMYYTEIFWEEVAKVSKGKLPPERVIDFLKPFIKKLATASDGREIAYIKNFIFLYLIRQSDLGIEYQVKYEAWRQLGFPGSINSMQKVKIKDDKRLETSQRGFYDSKSEELDPRAGRTNVELAQIKFKAKDVAEALQQNKFDKDSTTKTRRAISDLINLFSKMSNGVYPLGTKRVFAKEKDTYDMSIRKATNRLIKFENKLMGKDKKKRKRKNAGSDTAEVPEKRKKIDESVETLENGFTARSEALTSKKRKHKAQALTSEESKQDKREKKQGKRKSDSNLVEGDVKKRKRSEKPAQDSVIDNIECVFERNSGTWIVYDTTREKDKVIEKPSQNTGNFEDEILVTPLLENTSKRKSATSPPRSVLKNNRQELSMSSSFTEKQPASDMSPSKSALSLSPVRLFEGVEGKKDLFPKSAWEEPLQEGEYEICIPSRRHVRKLKRQAKKSDPNLHQLLHASMKQIRGKSRVSMDSSIVKNPFSTPGSAKKVKINTKLNTSQEIHEHFKQILSSPDIPYDADKKPSKPLLKSSATLTPVNPFYNKQLDI